MKTGWKIVGVISLVIIFLGALCVGIGLLTGAESAHIYSVLDNQFHITDLYQAAVQNSQDLASAFAEAGF